MSEPNAKLDISDLKDTFLECPVCVEHFNQTDRRPRLLHACLHAFCTPCLQKLLEKEGQGQITCPLCRRIQKVEDNAESLPGDPFRSKLVEYVDVQKNKTVLCSECSEQRDAISRCQDCQTYLCKECDFIHRGHRSTRDHSPISVQEALDQPIKSFSKVHFCPKHPKHHFEFYCTTDEHLCCLSCTVVDHKGHDLQSLEAAAASGIADIETSLANARGQADNIRESKKVCKRNEKHIQYDMSSTLSDINTVFDDLQTRLDKRRKMLIASVKEKGNTVLSSVHKESEALDETLAVIESTDTYFTQAKDKADVVEVLQIYPAMKRSLSNVQNIPPVTSSEDFEKLAFVRPTNDSIDVFVSEFDADSVGHGRVLSSSSTATGENKVSCGGAWPKEPRRSPNKPCIVTYDLYIAVQHFLTSETLKQCCEVEAEDDHIAIYFLMDSAGEASRIKQRILGIIQEVINVSSSEASKAESVARVVMDEEGEVYVKYDKNKQELTLFAEEWDKISKAKNRIQAKFGISMGVSQGARRFGPQTAAKTSDDLSTSSPTTKSGPSHVPGISSSPGTATGKNITVQVYKANILQLKVDVIVNAANGQLRHGGGVARAIAAAAGDRMTREGNEIVRQRGEIGVTDLAVTSAGNLPYKNIFHAVGPAWRDYKGKPACLEDVCRTVLRCLCEARKRNISSIAIPAISASILQVPRDLCARMYIRALKSFDQTVNGGPRIDVHFVDVSDKMVEIISKELDTNWSQPLGQDELDRDAAFIRRCLVALRL